MSEEDGHVKRTEPGPQLVQDKEHAGTPEILRF